MNPPRKISFLVLLISYSCLLWSQEPISYSQLRLTQGHSFYLLDNPASACSNNAVQVSIGNQQVLGDLYKISSYYAAGYFRINKTKYNAKPFSALGINFYNDQEGKYINRSRAYLCYSWHAKAFRKTRISGGFQVGAINYDIQGTPLSGDGSDIKPDASVGFQILRERIYAGISVNQIMNSELQPLRESYPVNPYLNVSFGDAFKPSSQISVKTLTSVIVPLLTEENSSSKTLVKLYARASYRNWFDVGIGMHNSQRMLAEFGVPITVLTNKQVEIHISYTFLHFQKVVLNSPLLELGLNLRTNE